MRNKLAILKEILEIQIMPVQPFRLSFFYLTTYLTILPCYFHPSFKKYHKMVSSSLHTFVINEQINYFW